MLLPTNINAFKIELFLSYNSTLILFACLSLQI